MHNRIPVLISELNYLATHAVKIGIFEDADEKLLIIASVNEYGCSIQVTDAMRGYLASQGLYLKRTTTHINIPERSYIRSAYDEYIDTVMGDMVEILAKLLDGERTGRDVYEHLGESMVRYIQKTIDEKSNPPNHPFTVERKGFDNPLVHTGNLRRSIEWRVTPR